MVLNFVHQMRGMTGAARDALRGMFGMIKTLLQLAGDMARQAFVRILFCCPMKTEYQFIGLCGFGVIAVCRLLRISVCLPRSMTRFTGKSRFASR
jgi:hypothetical protein